MNMEAPVARTRRIGELLVGKGVVSEDQVRIALTEQKNGRSKEHLGKILVRLGFATEAVIRDVLGGALGYDSVDLSKVVVDHDVVKLIPKEISAPIQSDCGHFGPGSEHLDPGYGRPVQRHRHGPGACFVRWRRGDKGASRRRGGTR